MSCQEKCKFLNLSGAFRLLEFPFGLETWSLTQDKVSLKTRQVFIWYITRGLVICSNHAVLLA